MAQTSCAPCKEMLAAKRDGWFVYIYDHEGWIFVDGPIRTMTPAAAYYASERGSENHTGEPYVWRDCPFCGHELLTPDEYNKWSSDATGSQEGTE